MFLNKIRNKGFRGCVDAMRFKIIQLYNLILFKSYILLDIDNNSIVLESEGDCCDNAYALFDYLKNNGYLEKYTVTWLVENMENYKNFENVKFVQKNIYSNFSSDTIKALRTCKWYIYDHCNIMANYKKRDGQTFVYLSHGWGYKAPKGANPQKDKSRFDFMTATGPVSAEGLSNYWGTPFEKTRITGYPRLDYLFQENLIIQQAVENKWSFHQYAKVIFWMPTFRQCNNKNIAEEYIKNETALPLFNDIDSLEEFDDFLRLNNLILIFKLHHLQANLPIFKRKFSNIIIVKDQELSELGIQLYQFIKYSDILITDYSSIAIDYLLMNHPIIYTLDDYDDYAQSRGLFPPNAIDYMPGYHIYSVEGLEKSLLEILSGLDLYVKDRKKVIDNYHTFKDGDSCQRVLKECGIC